MIIKANLGKIFCYKHESPVVLLVLDVIIFRCSKIFNYIQV